MLNALSKNGRRVFGDVTSDSIRANFGDSALRHWKATMLYHQTKDILHVMNFLGHKSIKNTMLYIQLEHATLKEDSDQFTCRATKTADEARELIKAGFEYACTTPENHTLFRKRKQHRRIVQKLVDWD